MGTSTAAATRSTIRIDAAITQNRPRSLIGEVPDCG
jgi:hypothetical protein